MLMTAIHVRSTVAIRLPVCIIIRQLKSVTMGWMMIVMVSSTKIGRISHASTIEFLPMEESNGKLPQFMLSVKSVQEVILASLKEEKDGDFEGGGWDMVEGGEEVLRGEGWLKLNPVVSDE